MNMGLKNIIGLQFPMIAGNGIKDSSLPRTSWTGLNTNRTNRKEANMKKIICALITIMLAGCGSNATAAVQESAESTVIPTATVSAVTSETATAEPTAVSSAASEALKETASPTSTSSSSPSATTETYQKSQPVDEKEETNTAVESVPEHNTSAAVNDVNPDDQGYWDANGNWVGYGWWNTDASGKAVYHYDDTYHGSSASAAQTQAGNDHASDNAYTDTPEQAPEYTAPVQNNTSSGSSIDAVAAAYDGQYAGVSCEGVAGQYLGVTYLIYANVYQVDSPQANDIIAYFDSGWNYKHTAVYLGDGKALHGSYNGAARVASMYLSYPNMVYFRMGGDTCYSQQIYNIAHANGGTAGWLDPLYR